MCQSEFSPWLCYHHSTEMCCVPQPANRTPGTSPERRCACPPSPPAHRNIRRALSAAAVPGSDGGGESPLQSGGCGGSPSSPLNTVKVFEATSSGSLASSRGQLQQQQPGGGGGGKRIVAETVVQAPVDVVRGGAAALWLRLRMVHRCAC